MPMSMYWSSTLLTGTPIKNRPVELVHQLKILDVLRDFSGAYEFKMRYCKPVYNGYGYTWDGASNLEELNMKLRAKCMIRRLKKDVMTELPPITHTEVPMELTNRATYNRAEADPIKFIYDEAKNDRDVSLTLNPVPKLNPSPDPMSRMAPTPVSVAA